MHVQMQFHVGKRLLTFRSRITSMVFKLTRRISLFLPLWLNVKMSTEIVYGQHKAAVDDLMLEVLRSVEKSANDRIPKLTDSNGKPNDHIPKLTDPIGKLKSNHSERTCNSGIRSGYLLGGQSTANYITLWKGRVTSIIITPGRINRCWTELKEAIYCTPA